MIHLSLGLCLSGGGIKGAAHIGVLQAMEDNNINIDYLSGTSSGSIVASLYAIGYTPKEIYDFFIKYAKEITSISIRNILKLIWGLIFKHKVIIQGLNDGIKFEKIIYNVCKDKGIYTINQVKFPLLIPSVNIQNGDAYIFSSKPIRSKNKNNYKYNNTIELSKAIRASCSFPGIYSPLIYDNCTLVDGGIRANIPWEETKNMGADTVLSVIFEQSIEKDSYIDIFEIITKSINTLSNELSLYEQFGSDYILKINTGNISLLDISKIEHLYNLGYSSMDKFIKKDLKSTNL